MIITDENMEFLNGSEAIKVIRSIENRKKCEKKLIISLTCHEDFAIIDSINKAGADYILSKPLSANKISPLLMNCFDMNLES
jgi:DNA-binding NarL/FixJ family response regulator